MIRLIAAAASLLVSVAQAQTIALTDANNDGQADVIYIQFSGPLAALPTDITSIDWPAEGSGNLSASVASGEIDFYRDAAGMINTSLVVIKLRPNDATDHSPESDPVRE